MFAKNAHKSISLWMGVLLAALMAVEQALPALSDVMSEQSYGLLKFAVGVAIPVSRLIKQKAVSGDV